MKLATLKDGSRDGKLAVVSRDLSLCLPVPQIARTLQSALDRWDECEPGLRAVYATLNQQGARSNADLFYAENCRSPLPRSYQWADGSAYVNHVELVRKSRGAEMPQEFWTDPLIYQGGSDSFLDPTGAILAGSEEWGIDLEAEVAVITGDVAMGARAPHTLEQVRLLMLVNDVSLRNLIPNELGKGFGFFQSKPSSAFSPVAVTPDELGHAWRAGKLHRQLTSKINGKLLGEPDCGTDMTFDFGVLIAHAAKTRPLCAGSIIGSGTVSNYDRSRGSSCLAEVRMLETIAQGKPKTPFLKFGDSVRIEMLDDEGHSIFGAIDQVVEKYS